MKRAQKSGQERPSPTTTGLGPLGPIESHLGYVLHRTDLLHMDILRGILAEIGLTPARATAMAFIRHNPACDQSTLARALGINRASAMEMVNALEALGAVERQPGRNRRSNSLHLTAEGERLNGRAIEAAGQSEAILASDLSGEERERLDHLLRRIRKSLDRHLSVRAINEN